MTRSDVVTVFLRNRGDVLLQRRAPDASTYPNLWTGISGTVDTEDPRGTARMAVAEEIGIEDVAVTSAGDPLVLRDDSIDAEWRIHPFLADVPTRDVTTNEVSTRVEWVPATEILRRETIPDLWAAYGRVRPTPETIAADTMHGAATLSIHALEALRDAAGLAAVTDAGLETVRDAAHDLLAARPAMAVVTVRIDRAMNDADTPAAVERAAISGIEHALAAEDGAAAVAADRLPGRVLTLSRSGTVTTALRDAEPAVVVAESRPAREGVEVAESAAAAGLEVTVCTDAAIAHVLGTSDVGAVLVGADTLLADGRVVNKTGTRTAAITARREGVPVYVVAASDKVSPDDEPRLEFGDPAAVYDGDAPIRVENPTFDVTPADCVDAVFTEHGPVDDDGIAEIAAGHAAIRAWRDAA